MFNKIDSFLEKFKKIIDQGVFKKQRVILKIKEITNLDIEEKNIKINNNILYINESPFLKNEIFMRKEKIIEDLKDIIKDIR